MWVVLWKNKTIKKIWHNRAPRGACTRLGARAPCTITIVMVIDCWEVYIMMFWDHVYGFMEEIFKNFGHNRGSRGACTWPGLGARVPCTKCTQAHARGGGRDIHQVHAAWRMSRPRECERSPREAPSSAFVNLVQHTRAPQSTVSTPRMLVNGAPSETWQKWGICC